MIINKNSPIAMWETAMELYAFTDNYFTERLPQWVALKRFAETMGFLEIPCSHKYHNAFKGGLFLHSMNVYQRLKRMQGACDTTFSKQTLALVGIFHDLGKIGVFDPNNGLEPRYLKTPEGYEYNPKCPFMQIALNSIILIARFYPMSFDETDAILRHDGLYIPMNQRYQHKERPLALILHWADYWEGGYRERR